MPMCFGARYCRGECIGEGEARDSLMKVAIASDHRGFHLKEKVISLLKSKGHTVIDDGPASEASVDYPDFAALVKYPASL